MTQIYSAMPPYLLNPHQRLMIHFHADVVLCHIQTAVELPLVGEIVLLLRWTGTYPMKVQPTGNRGQDGSERTVMAFAHMYHAAEEIRRDIFSLSQDVTKSQANIRLQEQR